MTHHPDTTYFSTLQAAKATLRFPNASIASKQDARDYLLAHGWTTKRLIEYVSLPYMTQYNVRIKREHTQAARVISVPALSPTDARFAAAVMYPNWIILTASHDATEKDTKP